MCKIKRKKIRISKICDLGKRKILQKKCIVLVEGECDCFVQAILVNGPGFIQLL